MWHDRAMRWTELVLVMAASLGLASACGDDDRVGSVDSGMRNDGAVGSDSGSELDGSTSRDGGGPAVDGSMSSNLERWQALCEDRQTTCSDVGAEYDDCLRTGNCYDPWIQPSAFSAYIDCIEAMGCDSSDDNCAGMAFLSVPTTPAGEAWETSCGARRTECAGVWGGDSPCMAAFGSVIDPAVLSAYEGCLAQPCDMIRQCLRDARPSACNG